MELNKLSMAGIMTLVMVLSTGASYYVQSLDSRTGCRAGWVYESEGKMEGYHKCITASNIRYETCFDVYGSANTQNYWCEKGKFVEVETEERSIAETNRRRFICTYKGCENI